MLENMQIDTINLAILWSLGFVAVSIAVNAKGTMRITVSFILAVLILAFGGFFTNLKISSLKDTFVLQAVEQEPTQIAIPEPVAPAQEEPAENAHGEEIAKFKSEAKALVTTGNDIANAILRFAVDDLSGLSDAAYEARQARAQSLRNQASNTARKIQELKAPAELSAVKTKLDEAAENLRKAGYRASSFFNAENEDQEYAFKTQFRSQSKKAQDLFLEVKSSL